MTHPWHEIRPRGETSNSVSAIVEIPRGGSVKYELDLKTGLLRMDRMLYSAVHFPANYGFIPQTLAEDDDPLDILVVCQDPVVPLTWIMTRPIGLMTMIDEGVRDHKVIAVARGDPEYETLNKVQDLPEHRLKMLKRFFEDYKALENKDVEVNEFAAAKEAREVIHQAIDRYQQHFHPGRSPAW